MTIAEDVNDVDRDQQIEDKTKAGPLLFVVQTLTSLFSSKSVLMSSSNPISRTGAAASILF